MVSLAALVLIVAVDVVFLINGRPLEALFSLIPVLLIVSLSGVGALLVMRRPGNAIGALLLFCGVLTAISWGGGYYVDLDDFVGAGRLPFIVAMAWTTGWVFTPTVGLMAVFLPMLFPTGHLPSPRWRIVAAIALTAITLGAVQTATKPGPLENFAFVSNPATLPQPLSDIVQALGSASLLLAPPIIALVIVNLIVRFRRSVGIERQQIKWFLAVASVAAFSVVVSIVTTGPISDTGWIVGLVTIACLPLAIGLAILRYRLYDIDRIVSRTVSYAATTAVLVVLFVAVNLLLQAVLETLTQGDTIAVAASTLAVFAIFQPLRRRMQAAVDRRFDRSRYEADSDGGGVRGALARRGRYPSHPI